MSDSDEYPEFRLRPDGEWEELTTVLKHGKPAYQKVSRGEVPSSFIKEEKRKRKLNEENQKRVGGGGHKQAYYHPRSSRGGEAKRKAPFREVETEATRARGVTPNRQQSASSVNNRGAPGSSRHLPGTSTALAPSYGPTKEELATAIGENAKRIRALAAEYGFTARQLSYVKKSDPDEFYKRAYRYAETMADAGEKLRQLNDNDDIRRNDRPVKGSRTTKLIINQLPQILAGEFLKVIYILEGEARLILENEAVQKLASCYISTPAPNRMPFPNFENKCTYCDGHNQANNDTSHAMDEPCPFADCVCAVCHTMDQIAVIEGYRNIEG